MIDPFVGHLFGHAENTILITLSRKSGQIKPIHCQ